MQKEASRAARARLDEHADGAPAEVVDRLRRLTEDRSNAVWERLGGSGGDTVARRTCRLRREMLDAEREVFRVARDEGRIPEEVLRAGPARRWTWKSRCWNGATTTSGAATHTDAAASSSTASAARPRRLRGVPARRFTDWVHLRLCLSCGHVGCCDSSPYQHATAHFDETEHPVMRSFEPGESWRWCYVDELVA